MKIKAKFKGSTNVFKNGENYNLDFQMPNNNLIVVCYSHSGLNQEGKKKIDLLLTKDGYLEYEDLKTFLNNWQVF